MIGTVLVEDRYGRPKRFKVDGMGPGLLYSRVVLPKVCEFRMGEFFTVRRVGKAGSYRLPTGALVLEKVKP